MVQDAVKKVLLSSVKQGSALQGANQLDSLLAGVDPAAVAAAMGQDAPKSTPQMFDSKGHRLYLPPSDTPTYSPTPIAELKRRQSQHGLPGSPTYDYSRQEEEPARSSSHMSAALTKVSELKPKPLKRKKAIKATESILGDINDLSDSDNERDSVSQANVLGSILMESARSGVLSNVNEVEHEVIKNKLKLNVKKEEEKEKAKIMAESAVEDDLKRDLLLKEEPPEDEVVVEAPPQQTSEDEALRLVREKERELQKIEEKRRVLENYYRDKLSMLGSGKKAKDDSIVISSSESSDSYGSSYDSYDSSSDSEDEDRPRKRHRERRRDEHRRRKKRKRRRSGSAKRSRRKKSDERRSSKSKRRRRESGRKKKRKMKKRRKTSGEESSSDTTSIKKVKVKEEDKEVKKVKVKKEKVKDVKKVKVEKEEKKEKEVKVEKAEKEIERGAVCEKPPKKSDRVEEDFDGVDDSELPETVRSFLEVMNELDEMNKVGGSSKKSRRKSDQGDKGEQRKGGQRKKEPSRYKERDKDMPAAEKVKTVKKHSDTSRHKSSRSKSTEGTSSKPTDIPSEVLSGPGYIPKGMDSPLPDISEELDMLPDELGNVDTGFAAEPDDDDDNVFNDEDDELKKIFDSYKPKQDAGKSDAAAMKKAKRLEEEASKKPDSSSSAGKKRTAHSGAEDAAEKRAKPGHSRRTGKPTPSEVLLNRYKQMQSKQEDLDLEAMLGEITEGKKRVAHIAPEQEALKRKVQAHRAATETAPSGRTVGHTLKGLPRLAHAPTGGSDVLKRPIVAADPSAKVPHTVRQRYLDTIVDECLKIYNGDRGRAHDRAIKEEKMCSERSKSRMIYLNVVVNCIKKLRAEAVERAKNPMPSSSSRPPTTAAKPAVKPNMLTTHLQVLAGKGGATGSWSIEKPMASANKSSIREEPVSEEVYYSVMKRYLLKREELEENGYPIADPKETGKALVREDPLRPRKPQPADRSRRNCDR